MEEVSVVSQRLQERLQHLRRRRTQPLYTRTDVQKLLISASYHHSFTPGFARIAVTPTGLLQKDKRLTWIASEGQCTRTLTRYLRPSLVLTLAYFGKCIDLAKDASDISVGLMLSQQAEDSK